MKTMMTSDGLRSTLFKTLESFLKGEVDAAHAKTVSKICDSITKSAAVDIEYKKLVLEMSKNIASGPGRAIADLNLNVQLAPPISNSNQPSDNQEKS